MQKSFAGKKHLKKNKRGFHIAIDGPVAAGKSTTAKKLAEKIGFLYIDTGSMYRAVTLGCLNHRVSVKNARSVAVCMAKLNIEVHPPEPGENHKRLYTVILDGKDVSWDIRTSEIDKNVPIIASYPTVRAELVKQQRAVAKGKNIVMEGRDITYRVLPEADLKIYLTANEVVRAKRHHEELKAAGEEVDFDDVLVALTRRDSQDMSRKTDPLKVVPDAWVVDTSDLTITQVVDMIAKRVMDLRDERYD